VGFGTNDDYDSIYEESLRVQTSEGRMSRNAQLQYKITSPTASAAVLARPENSTDADEEIYVGSHIWPSQHCKTNAHPMEVSVTLAAPLVMMAAELVVAEAQLFMLWVFSQSAPTT